MRTDIGKAVTQSTEFELEQQCQWFNATKRHATSHDEDDDDYDDEWHQMVQPESVYFLFP